MLTQPDTRARAAAWCAFALGVASAIVSAYWAAGGTRLLDTVGGSIERWGRERSRDVIVALVLIAALKAVVAVAAVLATRTVRAPARMSGPVPRALSTIAAAALFVYGAVLTVAGLLVQFGLITADPGADRHALAWHTWFWDPWFLVWGAAFLVALVRTGPRRHPADGDAAAQRRR